MVNELVFQESPRIELASNSFQDVPTILQYEDIPLIEVVRTESAGYTTQISIYHSDGTFLARVKGAQMYRTAEGEKAGVSMRHPGLLTVCEMNGKPIFELKREQAAALKLSAELYTNDGIFIKTCGNYKDVNRFGGDFIGVHLPSPTLKEGWILGFKDFSFSKGGQTGIGIHLEPDGKVKLGTNCLVQQNWKGDLNFSSTPQVWWLQLSKGGKISNVVFGRYTADDPDFNDSKSRRRVMRWP